jgi:hypothetical protein
MTLLNFPSDPASVDNIYVGPNGVRYIFDGVKWVGQSAGGGGVSTQLVNGSHNVAINPNGTIQFPYFTFPATDGTSGQVLETNGSGVLSWATISVSQSLGNLTDVSITGLSTGQVLKYNGLAWVNSTDLTGTTYTLPHAASDTLGGIKVGTGLSINGDGVLSVTGSVNTGNYTFSGDNVQMPLVAKLNSGGVGVTNSAEFGTNVTMGQESIAGSEIYMGAGTAESRAIVDGLGRGLMYLGVENAGAGKYAGIVARDPNVEGQYSPGLLESGLPMIGAGGDSYATTVGVMNENTNLNGIYVDEANVLLSNDTYAWRFNDDGSFGLPAGKGITFSNGTITTATGGLTARAYNGNFVVRVDETQNVPTHPPRAWTFNVSGDLSVPGEVRNAQGYKAIWENELPTDVAQLTAMLQGINSIVPNVNWDGGAAASVYEIDTNADGGYSSTRWSRNSTRFDGGANGEQYTLSLNGGGA